MSKQTTKDISDNDEFLVTSIDGLTADTQHGLPLGYAYLIRSSVRMPELYPLLGELVFGSCSSNIEAEKINDCWSGVNVIGMFVDDHRDTLFMNLYKELKQSDYVTDDFLYEKYGVLPPLPQTAMWMDTFGEFGQSFSKITPKQLKQDLYNNGLDWHEHSILGAGNPMSMFRFVKQTLSRKAEGGINLYLLNSLSNLYRNLGIKETSAFLKVVLNQCIWTAQDPDKYEGRIGSRPALFFAVLQEGVMNPDEESYLSSFFDGIIQVSPDSDKRGGFRLPVVEVKALPETVHLPAKFWYLPHWRGEKVGSFHESENTFFIKSYRE